MSRGGKPGVRARSDAGFTLIEALVSLAIGAFVIAALATVSGQWLREWRHGAPVLQRAELLAAALDRAAADLSQARFMPASATDPSLMFAGESTSVTFVRPALAVEVPGGLEVVRLDSPDRAGEATLLRSRAPLAFGAPLLPPQDASPVALLRQPYAMRFSYAADEGAWTPAWHDPVRLPRLIRLDVVDRRTGRPSATRTVALRIDAAMPCSTANAASDCDGGTAPAAAASSQSVATPAPGDTP